MDRRRFLRVAAVAGILGIAGCNTTTSNPTTDPATTPTPTQTATHRLTESSTETTPTSPNTIFVAPDGTDSNSGAKDAPVATIQTAIKLAKPGQTVHVNPGHYYETVETIRDGKPGKPITLTGPPNAVLHGGSEQDWAAGFVVKHSHIHLTGLTLDGFRRPNSPDDPLSYANLNYYTPYGRDRYLEDLVVKPHAVGNVRQAAVKFGKANNVEVGEFEVIGPAGIKHLKGDEWGHNGEIVYIGTPYANLDADYMRFDGEIDTSHNYHVHHIANTAGHPHSELVDAKEGSYNVLIEYCTDAGGGGHYRLSKEHEPDSEPAMSLSGRNSTLRWCRISGSRGYGIKVGFWGLAHPDRMDPPLSKLPDQAREAGRNNSIYGNRIMDNGNLAIKYPEYGYRGEIADRYGPDDQRIVCGNTYNGKTHGNPDKPCPDSVPEGGGVGHTGGDNP